MFLLPARQCLSLRDVHQANNGDDDTASENARIHHVSLYPRSGIEFQRTDGENRLTHEAGSKYPGLLCFQTVKKSTMLRRSKVAKSSPPESAFGRTARSVVRR